MDDNLLEAATLALEELAEDPYPADSIELDDHPDIRRVKFAVTWRIVYRVPRSNKRVIILHVRPRATAYEYFPRKRSPQ